MVDFDLLEEEENNNKKLLLCSAAFFRQENKRAKLSFSVWKADIRNYVQYLLTFLLLILLGKRKRNKTRCVDFVKTKKFFTFFRDFKFGIDCVVTVL